MKKWIREKMSTQEKAEDVIFMIENVSFSKEDKVRKGLVAKVDIPTHLIPYMIALRDADRLEAIGQIGIERCIQFTLANGGKVPEDVV